MSDAETEAYREQREHDEKIEQLTLSIEDHKAKTALKYLMHYVGQPCMTPKGRGILSCVFKLCDGTLHESLCQCVRVTDLKFDGATPHLPFFPHEVKPILRRSTHMTKEEALEIGKLSFELGCPAHIQAKMTVHKNTFGSWVVKWGEDPRNHYQCNNVNDYTHRYNQMQTLYLMNRGVDIFGAISEGVAYDITVLDFQEETVRS